MKYGLIFGALALLLLVTVWLMTAEDVEMSLELSGGDNVKVGSRNSSGSIASNGNGNGNSSLDEYEDDFDNLFENFYDDDFYEYENENSLFDNDKYVVSAARTGCQRSCSSYPNKIFVSTGSQAGLNDRIFIFHHYINLAAYLCAELYYQTPHENLAAKHNNDRAIPESVSWSDLIYFEPIARKPNGTKKEKITPLYYEMTASQQKQTIKQFNSSQWYKQSSVDYKAFQQDFERLEAISFGRSPQLMEGPQGTPKNGFVWNIRYGSPWRATGQISQYFAHRIKNEKSKHSSLPLWPIAPQEQKNDYYQDVNEDYHFSKVVQQSGAGGCPYTELRTPQHLKDFVNDIWNHIKSKSKAPTNSLYGSLHVRRGDAKGGRKGCKSDATDVRKYLQCSLSDNQKLHKNLVLVFSSDEKDPAYRAAIRNITESTLGGQYFDGDKLVMDFLQEAALRDQLVDERRLNNYYLYAALTHLSARADFRLDRRRSIHCVSCAKVLKKFLPK